MYSQSAQAKAWHRVTRQFLAGTFLKYRGVYLGGAQAVIAQNLGRRIGIHQHEGRADAFAPMLIGKAFEKIVEYRNAAIETVAVMYVNI